MDNRMSRRSFLAGTSCAAAFVTGIATSVAYADESGQEEWDYSYDVVVVGYGVAGGTAARHAAEAGAHVLLCDAAPEGMEGGNSKYAGQLIGAGTDLQGSIDYVTALNAGYTVDPDIVETFAEGLVEMRDYISEYLDVEPVSRTEVPEEAFASYIPEHPQLQGSDQFEGYTVTDGSSDQGLWLNVKEHVEALSDVIDVWNNARATKLVQADDGTVVGVVVEREEGDVRIEAGSGVVLACGGFEYDSQMIQEYLGASRLAPIGTPYNRGDGIRLALGVGADLWHLSSYEPMIATLCLDGGEGVGAPASGSISPNGSTVYVGPTGARYHNEKETTRHGRVLRGGEWVALQYPSTTWNLFDQTRMDELVADGTADMDGMGADKLKSGATLSELAEACGMDASVLEEEIEEFNSCAQAGTSDRFGRDPETMRAFDDGPYYAAPGIPLVLNTQGGPRRNAQAQVLDMNGDPIPHLFAAGECGSIHSYQYQGGFNLAECLIFGRIAGENAAAGL